jgi:copper chaperone CopZ
MDDNGDTTMTLEQMTTTGCNKAMKACVDQLTGTRLVEG